MDEPTRRAWRSPELIVLVRSGPEEAVLTACKGTSSGGPTSLDGNCTDALTCNACGVTVGS